MSLEEQNKKLIIRLYEALRTGNEAVMREILHEDLPWWVSSVGTMNRETLIGQLQNLLANSKVAQNTIIGTTAEGERVAVETQGNYELKDGRTYANQYHVLFTIHNNRVVSVKEYLDTALVARIFGPIAA